MRFSYPIIFACLLLITIQTQLFSQSTPKEELRATWVASVFNLDWPDNKNASMQNQLYGTNGLIPLLDDLKAAGINSVFFQVRTQCDALYNSNYEPWSEFISGTEGQNPGYDPLAIIIEECHKRGMELHAWFNPYRASVYSASGKAVVSDHPLEEGINEFLAAKTAGITPEIAHVQEHVINKHPEWILRVKEKYILNPGLPAVKDYITDVVLDVVNNYDVDGVHFDDYFYPYPSNEISNEDASTFAEYSRGITDIGDWRRDNINRLMKQVSDSIHAVKDHVKFGISPFGIWKSGVPSWLSGMNAYSTIYADALAWIADKSVDYLTPQTYWAINFNRFGRSAGQDFIGLTNWWADQMDGIHFYTGHGVYRADPNTFSGNTFAADEMSRQITHVQANDDIQGSVYFRADNMSEYGTKGFADTLKTNYYKYPSLPPRMTYRTDVAPATPINVTATKVDDFSARITWQDGSGDESKRFVVYRVDSATDINAADFMSSSMNIATLTGETEFVDRPSNSSSGNYYYFVTEINRVGEESAPSAPISVGQLTDVLVEELPTTWEVSSAYPNPFNPVTNVNFTIPNTAQVSAQVIDVQGRVVLDFGNNIYTAGSHQLDINARNWNSGVYFLRIQSPFGEQIRKMTLLK